MCHSGPQNAHLNSQTCKTVHCRSKSPKTRDKPSVWLCALALTWTDMWAPSFFLLPPFSPHRSCPFSSSRPQAQRGFSSAIDGVCGVGRWRVRGRWACARGRAAGGQGERGGVRHSCQGAQRERGQPEQAARPLLLMNLALAQNHLLPLLLCSASLGRASEQKLEKRSIRSEDRTYGGAPVCGSPAERRGELQSHSMKGIGVCSGVQMENFLRERRDQGRGLISVVAGTAVGLRSPKHGRRRRPCCAC